jgi:putative endonuclease
MSWPRWPSWPPGRSSDKRQARAAGYGARVRSDAQKSGDAAETLVADRLIAAGWTILARNVHVGRYELELVAVDPGPPGALVAVEVRWRAGREFGLPEETVDHGKRSRVRAAAYGLLERGALPNGSLLPRLPLRFDLVVVEPGDRVRHHRHAM